MTALTDNSSGVISRTGGSRDRTLYTERPGRPGGTRTCTGSRRDALLVDDAAALSGMHNVSTERPADLHAGVAGAGAV